MTTMTVRTDPTEAGAWVEAAPFRAHLRHLMEVGAMSSATVALLAGLSPAFTHRLLHGRGGRPLKRVNPESARQLLLVTARDVRAAGRRIVPAGDTADELRRLVRRGWSGLDLAQRLGVPAPVVDGLLDGSSTSCTHLLALRTAAQVSLLLPPVPIAGARARTAA